MEIKYSTLFKVPQLENQTEKSGFTRNTAAEFILCAESLRVNCSEVMSSNFYLLSYRLLLYVIVTYRQNNTAAIRHVIGPNTVF